MKIFHQNVKGLFSNKPYVLELLQTFKGIDILPMSETHINDQDPKSLFEIPGYTFICNLEEWAREVV